MAFAALLQRPESIPQQTMGSEAFTSIWHHVLLLSDTWTAADAAPLYEYSSQMLGWTVDEERVSSMRKANEEQLSKLEASIKDAEENLGDIEVRDAFLAKADYLYKIGIDSTPS